MQCPNKRTIRQKNRANPLEALGASGFLIPMFDRPLCNPTATEELAVVSFDRRVCPLLQHLKPDTTRGATQDDIGAVLKAADVQAILSQPFFWMRNEHRTDLDELHAKTGMSAQELCEAITAARDAGRTVDGPIRRITELQALISRGRGNV